MITPPTWAHFCQTDPAGYVDTMNLYAYCANNPVNWIDPWGLDPDKDGSFEGGGGGSFGNTGYTGS